MRPAEFIFWIIAVCVLIACVVFVGSKFYECDKKGGVLMRPLVGGWECIK